MVLEGLVLLFDLRRKQEDIRFMRCRCFQCTIICLLLFSYMHISFMLFHIPVSFLHLHPGNHCLHRATNSSESVVVVSK